MYVGVIVFVILLALVFIYVKLNSNSNDTFSLKNILIFGLSNTGKTKLFYKITEGYLPLTTTSFTIN